MDRAITNSIIRFILLWTLQVFILRQFVWGWGGQIYLQVHAYPLFILLLPLRTSRLLVLTLAFALGLAIDWFSETLGMHAAALVFTAFLRAPILAVLEPREKYALNAAPTKVSQNDAWFFRYAGLLMLAHLFFYFSVEAFTFVYLKAIVLKTIVSWVASMGFILALVYIFNPKA